ncbi:Cullin-associated NEDD8-dissociated protein 1 [Acipenser ruthenus]|uniref:Cullin-associated NEDD8-dissociated protein 1 n=1 Tax=Acipenser ruthenus TaxID=7906 RepID=A0A444V6E2_ACIRT|nr:Cullin-associated NEDD8-dissociated protein 1 [Acipenser ruthenus]
MASMSYHISNLLEKMTSTDKDFRFMATNDLMAELQKDSIKLDEDSENKVVTMLLKLLEDKNGEVQNLAVKCLGPLVGKVKEYQVETIVDTLCTNMLSDKEQLRDSSSMGLKTVIAELPPASTGSALTANVCKKITAQLTGAISKQEDVSVQLEALDILSDMLSRLGSTLISFHSPILSCLLPQLTSPRLAVRKRAIIALSHLVPSCSAAIFTELMKHLLTELSRNESTSTTRTYIQCLAAISRQAGHRVGEHLEKIIPVLVKFCNVEDDELREYCFQAFESFVRRFMATNDLMAELQKDSIKLDEDSENKVVTMLLKLLEDKNGEVQNLAVKCLGPLVGKVKEYQVETIVDTLCTNMLSDKEQLRDSSSMGLKTVIAELPPASTGSALTANVCKKITAQLTGAISKQEDVSVQLEALDILSDMLSRLGSTLISFHSPILSCLLPQLTSPRLAVRKRAIIALSHLVPSCSAAIFTELMKHLLTELSRNESTSTTRTYIQCLAAISRQAGHRVGEHLEKIIPVLVKFCNVEDDELREYCFQAFESFVRRCPKEMSPHIPTVIGLCLKYITYDPNYNYDNDEEDDDNAMDTESGDEEDEETGDEYSDDDDMSWKVRRSSVKCLEAVMSTRHDMLQDFYKTVSPALIARFKEREENVKADIFLAYMALLKQTRPMQGWLQSSDIMGKEDSSLTMLKGQVPNVVKALHKQLKEKSIKSRQGCLCLLTELANVLPGALADHIPALIPGIVYSLTDKSSSSNMKIDSLSFLTVILCNHPPETLHPHIKVILPPVVACIGDPFYKITSEALLVTQQLVKVIRPLEKPSSFDSKPYVKDLFSSTLKRLKAADIDQEVKERAISCMGPFYGSQKSVGSTIMHRQSYYSVAKCVAALSSTCPKEAINMVIDFIQDVKNTKSSDSVRILAFLCLAEVGRTMNLCGQKELKKVILEAFSSPNEEVKSAASYALGNICVGNLNEYLPFMLNEIGSQPKRQYLLLHSLKEVISSSSAEALKPYVEDIWTLLFKHCECSEEGTRNVVAECLGKLTLVNPAQLLPRLKKQLTSGSPYTRSTVVTAIKFTITDQLLPIDALLKGCIGDFLKTLQDPDLNVRRVALVMFNSAAHNKPSLIRDHLDSVLPHLYNETKIRKDLIREVEMGPFRHTVDDGLDVRKAAFECMYTLLDSCLDRLDIFEYLNHVEDGLKDHYDIRMLTFIMLARLSAMCPNAVMQRLDRLVEPLRATCTTKVKAGSVKQEFEKQDELKRSAMRAVAALLTIAEAQKSSVMSDFTSQIRANSEMASIFESIQKDTISSTADTETMDTS